jgi:hypothetical protein
VLVTIRFRDLFLFHMSDPEPWTDFTERLPWSALGLLRRMYSCCFQGAQRAKVSANSKRMPWNIENDRHSGDLLSLTNGE